MQEVVDLGRHAIACSRASGLWAALKVVTAVADAAATVEVGLDRVTPLTPMLEWDGGPYVHRPSAHLLAPQSLELERTLTGVRLELARQYARLNGLNAITHDAPGARLGIVASGTAYHDLRQALVDLGLGDAAPVRILKVGMLYPLDEDTLRSFAAGLDEVLVVEEKGPFLERLVKEALYGIASPPRIVGQRDERGCSLVPATGALDSDAVARAVGARLLTFADYPGVRGRLLELDAIAARPAARLGAQRTPFFCSGCPHSSSTVAADDAVVGAGIGCHTMVMLNPAGRGQVTGITQMGGEGAQWIGAAPFIAPRHFIQNIGDGTFHHSGSLAIRAAVAARLDVTYKLLYNDTVAMTGGQHVEGQLSVGALAHSLHAEGVERIVITTEDPSRYDGVALPAGTEVRGRDRLLATQRELAQVAGRHRADPRSGVRCRAAPRAQARAGTRSTAAGADQRARLRGVRRLRQEVGVPVGRAGRDRVRPQDAYPPGLVQQGLLLPRGRLPILPDDHPVRCGLEAGGAPSERAVARARAMRDGRRRARAARRHRRDGCRHRQPGARHGRIAGRAARERTGSDRPEPEGGSGRLRPAPDLHGDRGQRRSTRRDGRRPAGPGHPRMPRRRATCASPRPSAP